MKTRALLLTAALSIAPIAGMAVAGDRSSGSRTRGDGIGTAGDAPIAGGEGIIYSSPEHCVAGDEGIPGKDLANGRRSRGDGIGTAGDAPRGCQPHGRAGDAPSSLGPTDPAGSRSRGDGIGT
ncbi:MAG TPA: hypothetical protein VEB21_04340, partial [Terriglobales bacterium]|nr:hypothetical protein [Terriglobales bacterium]